MQDLRSLQSLTTLEINYLGSSGKSFEPTSEHFRIQFHDPSVITMKINMNKMNIDILKIFKKFNYKAYPVKQFIMCMHKFKFKDEKRNNEQTIMRHNTNHSF